MGKTIVCPAVCLVEVMKLKYMDECIQDGPVWEGLR